VSAWLLDTNVLSELRKPACAPQVRRWIRSKSARDLYVSRITFAEIRYGINRLPDGNRREVLIQWLNDELRPWFDDRILEVDEDVILRWRELVEIGRQSGRTFSQPDLFLAATADVHGLCLATRNTADFAATNVAVINPWD
jgi:predicted nucleic acid-binding protein